MTLGGKALTIIIMDNTYIIVLYFKHINPLDQTSDGGQILKSS